MSEATLFGLCAAALVGLGLYGLVCHPGALRKILAFNLLGSGVFLLFGVVARRGADAASGLGGDPVPQALVITGLVVAFAATAIAVALVLRLVETLGRTGLEADRPADPDRKPEARP